MSLQEVTFWENNQVVSVMTVRPSRVMQRNVHQTQNVFDMPPI